MYTTGRWTSKVLFSKHLVLYDSSHSVHIWLLPSHQFLGTKTMWFWRSAFSIIVQSFPALGYCIDTGRWSGNLRSSVPYYKTGVLLSFSPCTIRSLKGLLLKVWRANFLLFHKVSLQDMDFLVHEVGYCRHSCIWRCTSFPCYSF